MKADTNVVNALAAENLSLLVNGQVKPNYLIIFHALSVAKNLERLVNNITTTMFRHKISHRLERIADGKIIIRVREVEEAVKVASRVFGVSHVRAAVKLKASVEGVASYLLRVWEEATKGGKACVVSVNSAERCKHSTDFAERLSGVVSEKINVENVAKDSEGIDVSVEVFEDEVYVSLPLYSGLGGLPFGSQGKAVCLVSGGIDSPVAAWLAMKKGCVPIFIYYDNYPFTGETTKQRALDVIKKLSEYTPEGRVKVYVIPHGGDLTDILRNCPRKLTCVLCRRMMYRLAERVANMEGAEAIVTGEIIGEHASQTLRNLRVENGALTEVCVLRPLIGMDKVEVERLARKIGTFEASSRPALCCSAPPRRPRTHASLREVAEAEEGLSIGDMIERDISGAEILKV
jgi:thiamine biosynthesis protein ThiI